MFWYVVLFAGLALVLFLIGGAASLFLGASDEYDEEPYQPAWDGAFYFIDIDGGATNVAHDQTAIEISRPISSVVLPPLMEDGPRGVFFGQGGATFTKAVDTSAAGWNRAVDRELNAAEQAAALGEDGIVMLLPDAPVGGADRRSIVTVEISHGGHTRELRCDLRPINRA